MALIRAPSTSGLRFSNRGPRSQAAPSTTRPMWAQSLSYWSYSTVRKYSKPYLRTLGNNHVTLFLSTENIRLGPVLTDRESVPTASRSPVSPFLRFVVTEPSRMKSLRTERCHVGLSREFVGTACCTYGQSNTTNAYQLKTWSGVGSEICQEWFPWRDHWE